MGKNKKNMEKYIGKIKKIIRNPLTLIIMGVVAFVVLIVFVNFGKDKSPVYDLTVVKKGEVVQEVSVTGRVKSAENVDLAFEKSGKVSIAPAKVGDSVKAGQLLAGLVNSDVSAQYNQALASVDSAKAMLSQYNAALDAQEAKLDELKIGTRSEEMQIAQTKVENAQKTLVDTESNLTNVESKATADLSNLYGGVKDILDDGYVKADDAVNKQIDELFIDESTDNPQLTFFTSSQAETDAEAKRVTSGTAIKQFRQELDGLLSDQSSLDTALVNADNNLKIVQDFLDALSKAVNESTSLTQATLTNYKYYVNTGRTNVNTALTNVNAKKQAIVAQKALNQLNITTARSSMNTAKNSLTSAQDELALKKAGATTQQVATQEAAVNQAKANIESQLAQIKYAEANAENYRAQLSKTMIISPIDGIVTKQECKVGEIVSASVSVVSVISEAQFEIEANIPEADTAKVKIGDSAKITLDTYGSGVIFEAKVIKINPAETILEGVATYKTTLQFTKEDERIKSGMTSNIDILTAKKENVIFVPQRAVFQKDGSSIILVNKDENKTEERKVEIGLKGSDGNVEIISGLNENEKIVASGQAK